jgi:hypothetical protein
MDVTTMAGTGQFEAALKIVETLRARGYEAYLAGGCVRDLLLGREPADYDVATSAPPEVVLEMFPRTFAVGAHFGVVLVAPESEDRRICYRSGDVSFGFQVFRWAASRWSAVYEDRRGGCEAAGFYDQWAAAGSAARNPAKGRQSAWYRF